MAAGACRLGWGICQKPAIPKPAGIRRLDLILECQDTVIVLDVTIVADNVVLYQAHQRKCYFYNQPGIRDWVSTPTYLFISHFELDVFGMTRRHREDLDKTVQWLRYALSYLSFLALCCMKWLHDLVFTTSTP